MRISVTDAKDQLDDLVRRAAAGDEVVLTRDNGTVARLVPDLAHDPVNRPNLPPLSSEERLARIRKLQASVAQRAMPGPSAARSQDFLYDEFGLPK